MKTRNEFLIVATFGALALGGVVAAGYWEQRIEPGTDRAVVQTAAERKAQERRRGRIAEPAIADTTVQ
ncbi:hypothetical protein ACFQ15_02790 [Sphingomonas hankookensis]|uniref:hypothetical protein n=1 Tax=Sphingomonas hankookensis TaxID=563996 RepID=UPI001F58A537|nr:hypothetical protein [Sphingomonas hankookensis]